MEKFDSANPYNPNEKKSPSKKVILVTGAIVFFLLVLAFKSLSGSNSNNREEVAKYTKEDALAHSQVFIGNKLISPAAKFDSSIEGTQQINDTVFKVASFVDSQNKFGALIRNKYSCEIIFHPKTETHDVVNVKIE